MIRALLAALVLGLLAAAVPARADDNRPLTITITPGEVSGSVQVRWKIPPNLDAGVLPELAPPEGCAAQGRARRWSDAIGHWREAQWQCRDPGAALRIGIGWPRANPGLATIARWSGPPDRCCFATQTVALPPGAASITIAAPQEGEQGQAQSGGQIFPEFLKLGFEHIWEGLDHLLFVTGLIMVAGSWRRVVVTITGFTIAHSLTLALSALDLVRMPARAVEVLIALSIVFLAVEIAKGPRDTLTWRRPVAVAASFGLLHGFGFASVLREIGLPQGNLVTALLAFNIGIEIGQVIFAALVLAAWMALRKLDIAALSGMVTSGQGSRRLAGYALGIVASTWLFQRLLLG